MEMIWNKFHHTMYFTANQSNLNFNMNNTISSTTS